MPNSTSPDALMEQMEAIQNGLRRSGRRLVLSGTQAMVRGTAVMCAAGGGVFLLGGVAWMQFAWWCGVLALDLVVELLLYVSHARRAEDGFVTGLERQLIKFLVLLAAVGGTLTAAQVLTDTSDLIPGTWMLVAGAGYVAVGLFSFSRTWVLGLAACVAGAAVLFAPPFWSVIVLGVLLGAGSFIWGAFLRSSERARE